MGRWYDKYDNLKFHLDSFKEMDLELRDKLIKGVIGIIHKECPALLASENAFNFPLDLKRRRWYDKDPYLWLLFNTLKNADEKLLEIVTAYLKEEVK